MNDAYLKNYQHIIKNNSYPTPQEQDPYAEESFGEYGEDWEAGYDQEAIAGEELGAEGLGESEWSEEVPSEEALGEFDGEELYSEQDEIAPQAELTDRQKRTLEKVKKYSSEISADYQAARKKYDEIIQGESLSLEEKDAQMDEVLMELERIDRDFSKLEKHSKKLERDGIDVENTLLGGDGDELMGMLEEQAAGDEEDPSLGLDFDEEIKDFKTEVQETSEGIDQAVEEKAKAEEAKAKEEKEQNGDIATEIENARGYLTGDHSRWYYAGSATGKHIYHYYDGKKNSGKSRSGETDVQGAAKDFFTQFEQAARSGNWDAIKSYADSIDENKVGYVMTLTYAILGTHKPEVLEKLPTDVLENFAANARRGSTLDYNNDGIFYLDKGSKGKWDLADHKRRRNNKDTGLTFGAAADYFDAQAITNKNNDSSTPPDIDPGESDEPDDLPVDDDIPENDE